MKKDKLENPEVEEQEKKPFGYVDFGSDDDDDDDDRVDVNWRTILGGDILTRTWFKRNVLYILLCVVLLVFYISERYACQKETLRTVQLQDTLLDRQYKLLTISSKLKEQLRPSVIEENLADTALHTPTSPVFVLPVESGE